MNVPAVLGGVVCGLALGLASAPAGIITTISSGTIDLSVPSGNPAGIVSALNVSGMGNILSSGDNVSVTLNISGGWNGDLYAYLSFDGQTVNLLNSPGQNTYPALGYQNAGYNNVTLSDGSYGNINTIGSFTYPGTGPQVTGGPYNPADGNAGIPGSYNLTGGATAFQTYNGINPNGSGSSGWVLFVANLNEGSPATTLDSWSLTLDTTPVPVPEPVNVALGVVGMLFVLIIVASRWANKLPVICPL
jgi:hypothetical protein